MSALRFIAGALRSESVRAAIAFGAGGVLFALGNLLLARYLEPAEYALVALLLALKEFGHGLGPFGIELIINRHRLAPTRRLFLRVLATSTTASVLITWLAWQVYEMPSPVAALLFVIIVGSSLTRVAAAMFQSDQRFGPSLALTQIHNVVLVVTVPVGLALGRLDATIVAALIAAAILASAPVGWIASRRMLVGGRSTLSEQALWRQGVGGLGISLAALVLWQAERLLIPIFLSLEMLAVFGVLASVIAAPFRMMQIGIGYTLLPRIRATKDPRVTGRLLRSEVRMAILICACGTLLVATVGPWIIELFVGNKYRIGPELYVAAILSGYVKIWQGLAVAAAAATGSDEALSRLNAAGWVALTMAGAASWALAGYGIAGIIYGVGIGWSVQAIAATLLARASLRARTAVAAR